MPIVISAQETILLSNDRFSGINGAVLSPVNPYLNENPWDANLVGADVFIQNDYAFISEQSVLGLLNGGTITTANPREGITAENGPNILDFYNDKTASLYSFTDVLGPSASFSVNIREKKFQLGAFSRLRVGAAISDWDNYFRFNNAGIDPPETYSLQPFQATVMNWGEIGLNLATEIFPHTENNWIIGVNLKYALGFDGAVVNSNKVMTLNSVEFEEEDFSTYALNYDIDAAYSTSYDFENNRYQPKIKGKGIGLDVGIAMVRKNDNDDWYDLKIGFNILDFGSVKFNGEQHRLAGNTFRIDSLDDVDLNSPADFFHFVSTEIYGNPETSLVGNRFRIGLPTALHFNLSKSVRPNHFFNVNWIQRTPVFENSLKRGNLVSASYSVQKKYIGFGGSASLFEYEHVQLGAYFRIGPLILGSENLFPMLFKKDRLHGADFYFAIKLTPFWDTELKRRQRSKCNCD